MADVRLGIDASGARQGADEFIRQIQRIQTAAREASGVGAGGVNTAALEAQIRLLREELEALKRTTRGRDDSNRSRKNEEAIRLAQIRSGISYLRVINDEQASYAR